MTTERLYLLLTAILTGALWIPVVIGYVSSRGMLKSSDYKVARAFKFGGGGRGILHWQMGKARIAMRTLRDCYASLTPSARRATSRRCPKSFTRLSSRTRAVRYRSWPLRAASRPQCRPDDEKCFGKLFLKTLDPETLTLIR
jgi:hypothetical protein